jgi:hypothetical protein
MGLRVQGLDGMIIWPKPYEIADHDVWMKPKIKHNGDEYWEYVLI